MYWTSEHDVVLCREVVSENPFKTRKGSSQRSEIWDRIANTLNICPKPVFAVDKRSVRDHVGILINQERHWRISLCLEYQELLRVNKYRS